MPRQLFGIEMLDASCSPILCPLFLSAGGDLKALDKALAQLSIKLGDLCATLQLHASTPPEPNAASDQAPPADIDAGMDSKAPPSEAGDQHALEEPASPKQDTEEQLVGSHLTSHFDEWRGMLSSQRGEESSDATVAAALTVPPLLPSADSLAAASAIQDATTAPLEEQQQRAINSLAGAVTSTIGRALLPAGVDGACTTVYDEEPTSLIAYFSSTRCVICLHHAIPCLKVHQFLIIAYVLIFNRLFAGNTKTTCMKQVAPTWLRQLMMTTTLWLSQCNWTAKC